MINKGGVTGETSDLYSHSDHLKLCSCIVSINHSGNYLSNQATQAARGGLMNSTFSRCRGSFVRYILKGAPVTQLDLELSSPLMNAHILLWMRAVKWEPQMTGFIHSSRVCFFVLTLFAEEQKLLSETCLENNGFLSHPSASTPADIFTQSHTTHTASALLSPCISLHLETAFVSGG